MMQLRAIIPLVVGGVVKSSNRSISSAGTPLEEKPSLVAMCISTTQVTAIV